MHKCKFKTVISVEITPFPYLLVSFLEAIPNPQNHASGIYFSPSPVQKYVGRSHQEIDIDVVASHISPSSTVMASFHLFYKLDPLL